MTHGYFRAEETEYVTGPGPTGKPIETKTFFFLRFGRVGYVVIELDLGRFSMLKAHR